MQITSNTTIKSILAAHPMAVSVLSEIGLSARFLSDPSMLGTALAICKGSSHTNELDSLMQDLQKYIDAKADR